MKAKHTQTNDISKYSSRARYLPKHFTCIINSLNPHNSPGNSVMLLSHVTGKGIKRPGFWKVFPVRLLVEYVGFFYTIC